MKDADENDYFELAPYFAQNIILPIYTLVDGIYHSIPQLADGRPFVESNLALIDRIMAEDPEYGFKLNETECIILCQTMSVVKFYYKHGVLPNTEGKDNLKQIEIESRAMYDELMEYIFDLAENIFSVFPTIREAFYQDEIAEKKRADEAKTLGLDKTKKVIFIQLTNDGFADHVMSLFGFFDYFIINGKSEFSERVRESDFCCITEVNEVHEMFKKAMKATKRSKKYKTLMSIRDVVVVLMLNNIFQKAYFSDGGDDLHNLFAGAIGIDDGIAVEEVRDFMFKIAKNLEVELCSLANDMEGFRNAINPILEFPV